VARLEAARRAEMRVVWVPHPELYIEYQGIEKEVLAGRTGMFNVGDDQQLGQIDDGWVRAFRVWRSLSTPSMASIWFDRVNTGTDAENHNHLIGLVLNPPAGSDAAFARVLEGGVCLTPRYAPKVLSDANLLPCVLWNSSRAYK